MNDATTPEPNAPQGLQSKAGSSHPFHVTSVRVEDFNLPRAHTCFNKIDLPTYATQEEVKKKSRKVKRRKNQKAKGGRFFFLFFELNSNEK